jgi:hypothetical protein
VSNRSTLFSKFLPCPTGEELPDGVGAAQPAYKFPTADRKNKIVKIPANNNARFI